MWFKSVILVLLLSLLNGENTRKDHKQREFEDKANLALRQAGNALLLAQGDSTTSIPPVIQTEQDVFSLRFESGFDYGLLPIYLDQAFADFEISQPYEVMVRSCESDVLVLGFNKSAVQTDTIACQTRSEDLPCSIVQVRFELPEQEQSKNLLGIFWLVIPAAGIGGFLFLRNKKEADPKVDKVAEDDILLGDAVFNHNKQTIQIDSTEKNLTYRESKLLLFFAQRKNQVLSREEIQAGVWEDEGVVVGRSLDVFVSRLRKLFNQLDSVQIKTIHGVGYRLEVSE